MLPGADGLEIVQKLRAQRVNIPILILSAKRSVDDRIAGIQIGALRWGDAYFSHKPFANRNLIKRRCYRGIDRDKFLRSIDFPMDTNVQAGRRGKMIIHSGDTVLKAEDRLIIFSMKKAIPMAERFLAL
ncbi:MAG: hypothetical protein IMY79_00530 [Chloroflexi bacterium]|nr:hypothetical protein [Chloroflexota bacterium]